MRNPTRPYCVSAAFVLAAMILALPLAAFASGSYIARPPKPPAKESKSAVDRDRYRLGQHIFNDKVALSAAGDATSQRSRLDSLQTRLPESVARRKDLPKLAGRLTEEQLVALEYYVARRYGR